MYQRTKTSSKKTAFHSGVSFHFRATNKRYGFSSLVHLFWGLKIRSKGQLISKAIYGLLTSPKKRTDEFDLFAFLLFTANKTNSSVCFLGDSTACQSAFRFYLTFSRRQNHEEDGSNFCGLLRKAKLYQSFWISVEWRYKVFTRLTIVCL